MNAKETQRQTDEEQLNQIEKSMYFDMQSMEPVAFIYKSDFDFFISLSRKGLEADRYREALEELDRKSKHVHGYVTMALVVDKALEVLDPKETNKEEEVRND